MFRCGGQAREALGELDPALRDLVDLVKAQPSNKAAIRAARRVKTSLQAARVDTASHVRSLLEPLRAVADSKSSGTAASTLPSQPEVEKHLRQLRTALHSSAVVHHLLAQGGVGLLWNTHGDSPTALHILAHLCTQAAALMAVHDAGVTVAAVGERVSTAIASCDSADAACTSR